MASTAAERQKERHNRMIEKGFKKRAFYVTNESIEKLTKFKADNSLESLDEALNLLLKGSIQEPSQ